MAVTNPFTITYGSLAVGGSSSTLLLNGPYVIDKSNAKLRVVFDVVVVASSAATLRSLSESVEAAFSARDQSLTIDLGNGTTAWTYTHGTGFLNVEATCQKSGNRETDQGYSRAYTCIIEGSLPATDQGGLRELEVHTDYSPARQRTISMRGIYTATAGDGTATATYEADFDDKAAALLPGGATWELVHEDVSQDRLDHTAQFTRQYLELLFNQSVGTLDDTSIRDHRVGFTDLSVHPGDSQEGIYRLRRVVATYDCAVDIDVATDLRAVIDNTVMPHLIALFAANFSPRVYGIEESRFSQDPTTSRISVSAQFVYQRAGGTDTVEVSESVTTRETRQIDYTYVHNGSPLAAYADEGWTIKERIYSRTAIVLGAEQPVARLSPVRGESTKERTGLQAIGTTQGARSQPGTPGSSGTDSAAAGPIESGWNTVQNTSQSTVQYIGDPEFGQIQVTILTENVVQRYHEDPSA